MIRVGDINFGIAAVAVAAWTWDGLLKCVRRVV
jgi:hypothetical protein